MSNANPPIDTIKNLPLSASDIVILLEKYEQNRSLQDVIDLIEFSLIPQQQINFADSLNTLIKFQKSWE